MSTNRFPIGRIFWASLLAVAGLAFPLKIAEHVGWVRTLLVWLFVYADLLMLSLSWQIITGRYPRKKGRGEPPVLNKPLNP